MTAFAAVLESLRSPLKLKKLTLPVLLPGQVLISLAYSGVCRSQLNEIQGFKGQDHYLPHTLGHEGSGVVLEIGEGVTKVKPGDHVVLSWIKGKGADVPGCQYVSSEGKVNSGAISSFLSKAVISENRVIPIPKEMPLREAALLGCAIPTGAGVVLNQMKLQPGQSLAIFGLGGVGMSALLAAKHAQAFPLIAIDIQEDKLKKAQELGATHLINPKTIDLLSAIKDLTQGKGVDFSLECAGKKEAMEYAFQVLNPSNGFCVLAGNLPKGESIQIDPFDLILGKRIVGTWGGGSEIDRDIAHYVSLYLDRSFDFNPLVTHEIRLEEINDLLEKLEAGKVGRGLIKFI